MSTKEENFQKVREHLIALNATDDAYLNTYIKSTYDSIGYGVGDDHYTICNIINVTRPVSLDEIKDKITKPTPYMTSQVEFIKRCHFRYIPNAFKTILDKSIETYSSEYVVNSVLKLYNYVRKMQGIPNYEPNGYIYYDVRTFVLYLANNTDAYVHFYNYCSINTQFTPLIELYKNLKYALEFSDLMRHSRRLLFDEFTLLNIYETIEIYDTFLDIGHHEVVSDTRVDNYQPGTPLEELKTFSLSTLEEEFLTGTAMRYSTMYDKDESYEIILFYPKIDVYCSMEVFYDSSNGTVYRTDTLKLLNP